MSLAGRLANGPGPVLHGNPCSVATVMSCLKGPELEAFQAMLTDQNANGRYVWSERELWQATLDEGIQIGRQSIGRHRRRSCSCPR